MDKFSIKKHGDEWMLTMRKDDDQSEHTTPGILPYSQSSMFLSDEDVGELYVFIGSIYWRIFDGK
jgi:hypothetical protein